LTAIVDSWNRLARERNLPIAASIQNAYSLLNRGYEPALSEVMRREEIPLIPYGAPGFGHLTGKYLNCGEPKGARLTFFPPSGARYDKPSIGVASAADVDLASSNGLGPAKMAIAFVR